MGYRLSKHNLGNGKREFEGFYASNHLKVELSTGLLTIARKD